MSGFYRLLSYVHHFLVSLMFKGFCGYFAVGLFVLQIVFFRRSFFPTFQVSPIFVSGTLDSSCRHMLGDVNVEGCFLGMLDLGVFPWFGGSCVFSPFYQFDITAWN